MAPEVRQDTRGKERAQGRGRDEGQGLGLCSFPWAVHGPLLTSALCLLPLVLQAGRGPEKASLALVGCRRAVSPPGTRVQLGREDSQLASLCESSRGRPRPHKVETGRDDISHFLGVGCFALMLAMFPYLLYSFFFYFYKFIYLFIFIFGRVGSSFLCEGFLQLR